MRSSMEVGQTRGAFPFAKNRFKGERTHTMCDLLASSLAAALPDGLFEHLQARSPLGLNESDIIVLLRQSVFSAVS